MIAYRQLRATPVPTPAAQHGSISSTYVSFSGLLAAGSEVISGIMSENARGELISGWLSGAAASPGFALGTRCRMTDLSSMMTFASIDFWNTFTPTNDFGGNTMIYSLACFAIGVA